MEENGGSGTHTNLTMEITHMAYIRFGSTGPANRTFTTAAGNAAAMDLFSARRQSTHLVEGEDLTYLVASMTPRDSNAVLSVEQGVVTLNVET